MDVVIQPAALSSSLSLEQLQFNDQRSSRPSAPAKRVGIAEDVTTALKQFLGTQAHRQLVIQNDLLAERHPGKDHALLVSRSDTAEGGQLVLTESIVDLEHGTRRVRVRTWTFDEKSSELVKSSSSSLYGSYNAPVREQEFGESPTLQDARGLLPRFTPPAPVEEVPEKEPVKTAPVRKKRG